MGQQGLFRCGELEGQTGEIFLDYPGGPHAITRVLRAGRQEG